MIVSGWTKTVWYRLHAFWLLSLEGNTEVFGRNEKQIEKPTRNLRQLTFAIYSPSSHPPLSPSSSSFPSSPFPALPSSTLSSPPSCPLPVLCTPIPSPSFLPSSSYFHILFPPSPPFPLLLSPPPHYFRIRECVVELTSKYFKL